MFYKKPTIFQILMILEKKLLLNNFSEKRLKIVKLIDNQQAMFLYWKTLKNKLIDTFRCICENIHQLLGPQKSQEPTLSKQEMNVFSVDLKRRAQKSTRFIKIK